jgi:hypothetical protein
MGIEKILDFLGDYDEDNMHVLALEDCLLHVENNDVVYA